VIIGVGTDLVSVPRLRRAVGRWDRLLTRLFTEAEVAECRRRADPAPHLAARFAAKEACLKALRIGWGGGIRWREVEVAGGGAGPPHLLLAGVAVSATTVPCSYFPSPPGGGAAARDPPHAGFGVFLPVLAGEFGWSRGAISVASSINLLIGGTIGFLVGAANDRYGPRPILALGSLLAGFGYLFAAGVNALFY